MNRMLLTCTLACALLVASLARAAEGGPASAAPAPAPLADLYRAAAGQLIGAALVGEVGHARLGLLCDRYGHRLSGTPQLEAAGRWAMEEMRRDGLANVRAEEVMVPAWSRGRESARMLAPVTRELSMLGLGMSVGTPEGGLDAEVVVVRTFEELEDLGTAGVSGKAVLYDVPFTKYGETVRFRSSGPSRAAKLGAVAAFVKSVGPVSLDTPHTGALRYEEGVPRIPAAALSIESATQLARIVARGETVRIHLDMEARMLPDAPSANIVAEVRGSELPDEVVLIGGHLDSWDVGQGAQDDGVGCLIAWEAARLIQASGLHPRRTIRVVLFTNEENGTAGGKDYAKRHADALPLHVAAIESDSGNGLARGFEFQAPKVDAGGGSQRAKERAASRQAEVDARGLALLAEIAPLLEPLAATAMVPGGSGADVGPSVERGVAGLGLDHDTSRYFDIHHTDADTFDKVVKADLNHNIAIMAVMAYVLADMPERLVEPDALAPVPARGRRAGAGR